METAAASFTALDNDKQSIAGKVPSFIQRLV